MISQQVGSAAMLSPSSSHRKPWLGADRLRTARRHVLALVAISLALSAPCTTRAAGPEGQLTWAVHVTLAPTWFDPAETSGIITPYMVLYAIHDAMVKPMPGNNLASSLAESLTISDDKLTYEMIIRKGAKFHDGTPITAEDVKFSFERYRGAQAAQIKGRVASIETPDPGRVLFKLKTAWPDFLTFYASATGAGWVVPKAYVEKVGEEAFKKAPIGAGPYKFVSFNPGVELVLEAFEGYWRKMPSVKRLVFRVIPEEATRLAALKRGEVDIAYGLQGEIDRGAAAHAQPKAEGTNRQRDLLALFSRPVGREVALARRACTPGGAAGDRHQDHQPGVGAGLGSQHWQHRAGEFRVLLEAAGTGL